MVSRLHAVLACTGRDAAGSNDHVQMANDDQMLRLNPALYTLSRLRNISLREEDPGKNASAVHSMSRTNKHKMYCNIYTLCSTDGGWSKKYCIQNECTPADSAVLM